MKDIATNNDADKNKTEINGASQIDTFIDHLWLEDGLSKNTLESYRADLNQFNIWLNKQEVDLLIISQTNIQQYLAVKFPQSKPRSITRLIASLRRFYRYALREHLIEVDPTLQIESPKLPRSLPKSLNEQEVSDLLNAPDINQHIGLRDRAMLELLYASGLRVSELVTVNVNEVSTQDGVVRVTVKVAKRAWCRWAKKRRIGSTNTSNMRDQKFCRNGCAMPYL